MFKNSPVLLVSAMFFLVACEQKPSGGRRVAPEGAAVEGNLTKVVSYEKDIQPLLKKKCTSCHSGSQEPDLSTYNAAKSAANAIYRTVKAGSMPKNKKDALTSSQIALVKAWIDGGKKKSTPKDEVSASLVTYDNWVKGYLKKSCLSCHGSGSSDGDFSNYSKTAKYADDLLESMEDGRMPKGGKADSAAIAKMRDWIKAGSLEAEKAKDEDESDETEDDEKEEDTDEDKEEEETVKVTYDVEIKKIMNSYCIVCHSSGATPPELDSKSKVVTAGDAVLESVKNGTMPKTGALRQADQDLIQKWIDGGKL